MAACRGVLGSLAFEEILRVAVAGARAVVDEFHVRDEVLRRALCGLRGGGGCGGSVDGGGAGGGDRVGLDDGGVFDGSLGLSGSAGVGSSRGRAGRGVNDNQGRVVRLGSGARLSNSAANVVVDVLG